MQYIQLDKIDELNKYFYPNVFEELAESNENIKQYKINNCSLSLTSNMFVFENLKTNDSVRIHNKKNKTTILLDRVCEILDFLKISMKFEKMSGIIEWEIENHEWFDKYNTKKRNFELEAIKVLASSIYGHLPDQIDEHDIVETVKVIENIPINSIGTVVHNYNNSNFEVEFTINGLTIVKTLYKDSIKKKVYNQVHEINKIYSKTSDWKNG